MLKFIGVFFINLVFSLNVLADFSFANKKSHGSESFNLENLKLSGISEVINTVIQESKGIVNEEGICNFSSLNILASTQTKMKQRCTQLLTSSQARRGLSIESLVYTLRVFKSNFGTIRDRECLDDGGGSPFQGINNPCHIMINDMNSYYIDSQGLKYINRSNSYFINLCAGKLVEKSYVNRGVGSNPSKGYLNASYADVEDEKSTLIGAFITDNFLTQFSPEGLMDSYKRLGWRLNDSRCSADSIIKNGKSQCPVLRLELFGINSSNNHSESGYGKKPMHTSPYSSSFGCPSYGKHDNYKIVKLADNGPSLVMNWGPKKFHKDPYNCWNDSSE